VRIIITARGWRLIDLDIMVRVPPKTATVPASHAMPDPAGTVAAQVEQGAEPAPGFGFAGHVGTVVARGDRTGKGLPPMAAQKTVKVKSPAQVKANKAFAAAGRSAQAKARATSKTSGKAAGRTSAQTAAAKAWQQAGVKASAAARAARAAGKAYVPAKKPAAPLPRNLDLPGELPRESPVSLDLHQLPACAAVALAAHLLLAAGIAVPDEEILVLHYSSGLITLADLLERVAAEGFPAGARGIARLDTWTRCDPGTAVPGLLYGVQLDCGYHAVVAVPGGMTSWGGIWPRSGTPGEAWHLEWAPP
jgi:hypothetical protein